MENFAPARVRQRVGRALQPPFLAQVRYVRHPDTWSSEARRPWLRVYFGFLLCASVFLIASSGYIAVKGSTRARSWNWVNALVALGTVVQTIGTAKRLRAKSR